jgi:hypothetical protein
MNWYWYNKNEYIPYFYDISCRIENAFINGDKEYQISDRYIINFLSMTQINIRSGKEREIMRRISFHKPNNNFIWIINDTILTKDLQELLNFCEDFNRTIIYYNNFKYNLKNMIVEDILTHDKYELVKNDSINKSIKCIKGTCSICLENNNDKSIQLHKCKEHAFHKDCIEKWFTKSRTCPMCKIDY